jgi:polyphosphate kinase
MVRVAGLKGQVEAGITQTSADGLLPAQQLAAVHRRAGQLMYTQQLVWHELVGELRAAGVAVVTQAEITEDDRAWLAVRFTEQIFPVLTPLAVDPAHPFPFIANKGLALVMKLSARKDKRILQALIPVPQQVERFVRLPGDTVRFIPVEDVIVMNLDRLFPGYDMLQSGRFRLLRDSEM